MLCFTGELPDRQRTQEIKRPICVHVHRRGWQAAHYWYVVIWLKSLVSLKKTDWLSLGWNLQMHSYRLWFTNIKMWSYGKTMQCLCVLPWKQIWTHVFCVADALIVYVLSFQVGMEAMPCACKETWRVAAQSHVTHSWATRSAREISRSNPWRFGASRTLFVCLPVLRLSRETCSFTSVFFSILNLFFYVNLCHFILMLFGNIQRWNVD